MRRSFVVLRGFDRGLDAVIFRTDTMTGALAAAKRAVGQHRPVATIRDCLGGLRAEVRYQNERQGEFGREGDIVVRQTP